jgi:trehalose-phosphatase
LPTLVYGGNHGLEIIGQQLRFLDPKAAALRQELEQVCKRITVALAGVPGVTVEYKKLTASVHYRQSAPSDRPQIEEAVRAAARSDLTRFIVNEGKQAFDIMPPTQWNKGEAASWIYRQLAGEGALAVYLGDDYTDELAFRALPGAITVKVGNSVGTTAKYHLPGPDEVLDFLLWLASIATTRRAKAAQV